MNKVPSFFDQHLSGVHAFYKKENYLEVTKAELSQKELLPVSYHTSIESKVTRVAKVVFAFVFPVYGLYLVFHHLLGKIVLQSSNSLFVDGSKKTLSAIRAGFALDGEWKYKRITIEFDGYKIDAMIVGKEHTLDNGRWTLVSNGVRGFYERRWNDPNEPGKGADIQNILTATNSNALFFNYPTVGASSGFFPSKNATIKAYKAMLAFLEDPNGIGAREIIGYGHSLGGGVQGVALKNYSFKKDIHYVFIKSRTFSFLSKEIGLLILRPLGLLLKLFGWEMDSLSSSLALSVPEIIIQTAEEEKADEDIKIKKSDDVIKQEAALLQALLKLRKRPTSLKYYLGIREAHNTLLQEKTCQIITDKVLEFLHTA